MQYTSNEDLLPFDYGAMLLILIVRNQEADAGENALRPALIFVGGEKMNIGSLGQILGVER